MAWQNDSRIHLDMPPRGEGPPTAESDRKRITDMTLDELVSNFETYKESREAMNELSSDQRQELVRQIADEIIDKIGAKAEDVEDRFGAIRRFSSEDLLVRVEDPVKVLDALMHDKDIRIAFDPEVSEKYHNAVAVGPTAGERGLAVSLSEAHAMLGGIRTMVGFSRGSGVREHELEDTIQRIGEYDRSAARSVEGEIHPEDIRFVMMRVPIDRFPEERMTPEELADWEEFREEWEERGKRPQPEFVDRVFMFARR